MVWGWHAKTYISCPNNNLTKFEKHSISRQIIFIKKIWKFQPFICKSMNVTVFYFIGVNGKMCLQTMQHDKNKRMDNSIGLSMVSFPKSMSLLWGHDDVGFSRDSWILFLDLVRFSMKTKTGEFFIFIKECLKTYIMFIKSIY